MATTYNTHTAFTFTDIEGQEWQVVIGKDGLVGSPNFVDCAGSTPVSISYKGDEEVFTTIVGSEMVVTLQSLNNYDFEEFFEAAWGEYNARLIKNPSTSPEVIWQGYYVPDIFREPHINPPYDVELRFACGLARLDVIKFESAVDVLYEGERSIIEILRLATNKLPSPLGYREVVNVYEDNQTTTAASSPLNQTFVHSEAYHTSREDGDTTELEGMNCRDVIQRILEPLGVRMYHMNNTWHITRVQELQEKFILYRDYDANEGSESTTTVVSNGTLNNAVDITGPDESNPLELVWMTEPEQENVPKTERYKITYTGQNIIFEDNDLIRDGVIMDLFPNAGGFLEGLHWTDGAGIDPTSYDPVLDDPLQTPNANGSNALCFDATDIDTLTAVDTTVFFQQTKSGFPVTTSDSLAFLMRVRLDLTYPSPIGIPGITPAEHTAIVMFRNYDAYAKYAVLIKLTDVGTATAYYLVGDEDIGYSWSTSSGVAVLTEYSNEMNFGGIGQNFAMKQISTPVLPFNGSADLDFKVYGPYTNIPSFLLTQPTYDAAGGFTIQKAYVADLHLTYIENGAVPPTEVVLTQELDPDAKEIEVELFHGDGPSAVSQNSYLLSDSTITNAWARRGITESLTIHVILMNAFVAIKGEYRPKARRSLVSE